MHALARSADGHARNETYTGKSRVASLGFCATFTRLGHSLKKQWLDHATNRTFSRIPANHAISLLPGNTPRCLPSPADSQTIKTVRNWMISQSKDCSIGISTRRRNSKVRAITEKNVTQSENRSEETAKKDNAMDSPTWTHDQRASSSRMHEKRAGESRLVPRRAKKSNKNTRDSTGAIITARARSSRVRRDRETSRKYKNET